MSRVKVKKIYTAHDARRAKADAWAKAHPEEYPDYHIDKFFKKSRADDGKAGSINSGPTPSWEQFYANRLETLKNSGMLKFFDWDYSCESYFFSQCARQYSEKYLLKTEG